MGKRLLAVANAIFAGISNPEEFAMPLTLVWHTLYVSV